MPLLTDICEMYAAKTDARASCLAYADTALAALVSLGLIAPGDRVVAFCDGEEGGLRYVADDEGIRLSFASAPEAACLKERSEDAEGGRLFWLVSAIGGDGLRVAPLRILAREAQAAGAFLVVDNTLASSFCAHPLTAGCAFTCETYELTQGESVSRAVTALSVARSQHKRKRVDPLVEEAFTLFEQRGAVPAPTDADLRLLKERLDVQSLHMQMRFDWARAIAEYLAANEHVSDVRYPGLMKHPDHMVATGNLMHGFGPALEFDLPAHIAASAFLDNLPPRYTAVSHDGSATYLLARGGAGAHRVRLYAGIDNTFEVIDTIDKALRRAPLHL